MQKTEKNNKKIGNFFQKRDNYNISNAKAFFHLHTYVDGSIYEYRNIAYKNISQKNF